MMVRAKKSLGQNFLTSPTIAQKIAGAAGLGPGDTVLEVGPGTGMLTRELLATGARVIAVEKDRRLIPTLQEAFAEAVENGRLQLVEGDALEINPGRLGLQVAAYALVANIPYYITGALIRRFLEHSIHPHSMVLLVQKEVAERIAREKKGSLLSVSVRAYGTPRYLDTVSRAFFSPQPSVDSAILAIGDISRSSFGEMSESAFFTLVRAGFSAKRKLLLSNLTAFASREEVAQAFGETGVDEKARAEDLSIDRWFALARILIAHQVPQSPRTAE